MEPKENRDAELMRLTVVPVLPTSRGPSRGDTLPDDLKGATIINFGTAEGLEAEGGGLIIDYLPPYHRGSISEGPPNPMRLILAFTELGMWVERHLQLAPANVNNIIRFS